MIARSFGRELLERYGSPLYVYDLDEAERQAKSLFDLLPKSSQVLYSVKANPIPEVCAALKSAGCRVEIASPLELNVVFEAGFTPDQILCSGPRQDCWARPRNVTCWRDAFLMRLVV